MAARAGSWKITSPTTNTKQRERERTQEVGLGYELTKLTPSDALPLGRPHLLKVPQLPQTLLLTRDHVFKYLSLQGTFLI